ncbi:hypothetical protein [Streptomyces sp. NPDC059101]|uniref:hypothetical protein n=1 Tax=Streptomyces sp. NPDC059101 TaxID=3346728 RepID=UPI0036B2FA5C
MAVSLSVERRGAPAGRRGAEPAGAARAVGARQGATSAANTPEPYPAHAELRRLVEAAETDS